MSIKSAELANRKTNASSEIVKAGENFKKNYILDTVIPPKYSKNHCNRTCYIHDLEFYDVTYNCIGISVKDLVQNRNRNFQSMIAALHREIVELTNIQSGGIGFIDFDSDIASYIGDESDDEIIEIFRNFFLDLNVNTRKGCEKPYVTFNFGLNTSTSGRRAAYLLLEAFEKGDERGNPFLFPNLVFKLKSGVNLEQNSENYDLYCKALKVTAKRMVPTYFNCDSSSNQNYPAEKIGIMGCRTKVADNVNGTEGALNRGNIACVTLNLVQFSYQAYGDILKFYTLLEKGLEDAKEVLLHRFYTLTAKGVFDELYKKNYYLDSEKHNAENMLRNGTLSIGFIGLWDAVSTLHEISILEEADMKIYYEEAYEIISFMRACIDTFTKENGLNFSLLASAAEGATGVLAQYDSKHLGKGLNVCKKGYYTNSFHVPVNINMSYREKIELEGPFHKLCNGGSITYVEIKEMPDRNVEAVQEIVEYAYYKDCNYIGINFPMDNCRDCGYIGRIVVSCPNCNSDNIRRLRRVSGYLSEVDRFTQGKRKELSERKSHL